MIRDYKQADIDEIVRIYTLEYKAMPEEIENLKTASKILVYDDKGIQGFIHLMISGGYCCVEMGAVTNELIKTIGLKLWEEAKKIFKEKSINTIETFYVKDNLNWKQLFDEIGFEYRSSVYRFTYKGPKLSEPNLSVVKYEDKYYDDKMGLESEAFSVLRKENNIKPYNWYLSASKEALQNNRKYTLEEKEYIYLFFENNEMVGGSMVKNAEIDLLFVNIKHQGKGYGKKIIEFTVNRGLEQNAGGVNLNALASNEKALKLYKNTGFKVVQAQDCRMLIIK
ncbi:GNAT family N-acetyltransferase [Clostridium sp. FP2]|uniref:GNAT family N-acetyltransferase n=1 Tax=Clostridium TaxID=1485 RepID=UPI0013E96513|nr:MULTISPECIES: GNAT family N-acetyltransferase [Clostridium]MBW9158979.1 GNAT family N-acetyltransferase [Clostridium tagluense]MBZ9626018.1 GNAT family N-acetyltransferase [Clostridium sp. FP2]WLC68373.1 GNAT family N-acetyltransferase [Clostridium tagluense]